MFHKVLSDCGLKISFETQENVKRCHFYGPLVAIVFHNNTSCHFADHLSDRFQESTRAVEKLVEHKYIERLPMYGLKWMCESCAFMSFWKIFSIQTGKCSLLEYVPYLQVIFLIKPNIFWKYVMEWQCFQYTISLEDYIIWWLNFRFGNKPAMSPFIQFTIITEKGYEDENHYIFQFQEFFWWKNLNESWSINWIILYHFRDLKKI